MKLLKKLPSFLAPKSVAHVVDGQELAFYPVPVKLFTELRTVAGPIAKMVSLLFSSMKGDTSRVDTTRTTDANGNLLERSVIDPVTVEMARARVEDRTAAIKEIIDSVCEEKNLQLLARIILASLKDERDGPVTHEAAAELCESLTPGILWSCLVGVAKAHDNVFGPLLSRVREQVGTWTQTQNPTNGNSSTDA